MICRAAPAWWPMSRVTHAARMDRGEIDDADAMLLEEGDAVLDARGVDQILGLTDGHERPVRTRVACAFFHGRAQYPVHLGLGHGAEVELDRVGRSRGVAQSDHLFGQ